MGAEKAGTYQLRVSARLRLALSYAVFLVAAGAFTLVGVYIVLRYVPNYPLTAANPRDDATSIASREEILDALLGVSGTILLALAAIGISGGWVLAGWILRPLQRINETAKIVATGRLDQRVRLTGRNDEFRQLADTVDQMLDRLHDAFQTQERFAANASHELRTPLTISATLLEVARKNPEQQDYATLVERLSSTNARAIGLTEALLRLADANSVTATAEAVDLAAVARSAINEASAEAEHHGVMITAQLDAAPTIGDTTLFEQLLTNLIQNAIRHNHPSGEAYVTTGYDPQRRTATIRVENSGDRYTPEQAARLSEPFLRGNGRINRPGRAQGYGLGLALISRITTLHNGTLAILPREGGGLIATVTLSGQAQRTGIQTAQGHTPVLHSQVPAR